MKIQVNICDENGVVLDWVEIWQDDGPTPKPYRELKPEEQLARRVRDVLNEKFITDEESARELTAELEAENK